MAMSGKYVRVEPSVVDAIRANPPALKEIVRPKQITDDLRSRSLDIDKSWHVIHYLLTGDPWEGSGPLSFVVLGGKPISKKDLGFGPARFLTPEQVAAAASALDALSFDELWSRFDRDAMEEAEVQGADDPDAREIVEEHYLALQQFFSAASQSGEAIILWIG